MIKHLVGCLLLACALGSPLLAQAPAAPSGKPAEVAGFIVATRVKGRVTAKNTVTGEVRTLAENDRIQENFEVTTSKDGSVILIFENGATVSVEEDSELDIKQFEMDPFSGPVTHISDLTKEPTISHTTLAMPRGQMVGKVVHLDKNGGSEFTIVTPVGAAGIRGTTFELTFRPNPDGTALFQLTTADGQVFFSGTVSLKGVNVGTGKVISTVVTVATTNQPGQPTTYAASGTIASTDVSAAQLAAIATIAQTIVETVSNSNITLTPTSTSTTPSTSTTSTSSSSSTSTSTSTSSTQSSTSGGTAGSQSSSGGTLNTPPTPSLTPGD